MVSGGFLVDFERAGVEELRSRYPDAFAGPHDGSSLLTLERLLA
jgi:hypothetical protein